MNKLNQIMAEHRAQARIREEIERHVVQIIDALPLTKLASEWHSIEEEFADGDWQLAFYNATRIILRDLVGRDYDIRFPREKLERITAPGSAR
jgi:hypothetical protein